MLGMFQFVIDEYNELKAAAEEDKIRIQNEWQATKKLPRKLKKKRRKELSIDYQIACMLDDLPSFDLNTGEHNERTRT